MSGTLLGSLMAREAPSEHLGYLLGVSESIDGLAGVLVPALAGLLHERISPAAPAVAAGFVSIGALVLAAMLARAFVSPARPKGE